MKKVTIKQIMTAYAAVCIATLFASCDKIKDTASVNIPVKPSPVVFTVEKATRAASILKSATVSDVELYNSTLQTKLNHYLEKSGFSYENVRGFKLVKVDVKSLNPSGYDMSGFVGMKLYMGASEDLVAEAQSVSSDKMTLMLKISTSNLDKYGKTDNLPIVIKGPNPVSEGSVRLSMDMEFEAKVTPL